MKHDAKLSQATIELATSGPDPAANLGFSLFAIEAVQDGIPQLVGLTGVRRLLTLSRLDASAVGRLAVCQVSASDPDILVVHGVLNVDAGALLTRVQEAASVRARSGSGDSGEAPLILRSGRSLLRLEPNGRIVMIGDEVTLRSRGRMHVRGAYINLN